MRHFNTAGPVNQPDAYKIDPLTRWDTEEILNLINERKYFILHAPRQTGKTSCLLALRDYLNKEGTSFAFYANFELAQAARNNANAGIKAIVHEIASRVDDLLKKTLDMNQFIKDYTPHFAEHSAISTILRFVCENVNKPVVMFIDEIDALIGDTLLSVLRQLRSGYDKRPNIFPSSIILCGVRDIKDYRIHTSNNEIITGGSAFNIKTESLKLGNFSKDEMIELYNQHTNETGQIFTNDCYDLIMEYTDGQPWLVNALAREVTYKMKENRDRSITITPEKLEMAKERLILERQTHLDQLVDKLQEERVRNIISPMILGIESEPNKDDIQYCLDLGLIKKTSQGLEISNGIYREIIPRELTDAAQINFLHIFKKFDWIEKDGSLSIRTMLNLFRAYWNENSMIVTEKWVGYHEALPQLILQAFLQRIVNGGGYINREYAIGRKRTDIMIKWKYNSPTTEDVNWQNIILEIKTINKKQNYKTVKNEGLEQTSEYAKICGEKEAHLLIFDKDKSKKWKALEANEIVDYDGVKIEIWKFR
ncbi:MAG: ATP-binding protein [Candidatus Cloacimonetes bacterium]|nr:ATP-binding protein [Candidatus Cloacimonadota bacterium]